MPIKDLIAKLQKEGKSADDILKAVNDYKEEPAPPAPPPPAPPAPPQDPDLRDKVIKDAKDKADKDASDKRLESALIFTMGGAKFIEDHKTILPKQIAEIFAKADKENYGNAIDKANAIRSAVVESFFSEQVNLDLLTPTQKGQIEDYLKLTKKARDDKAEEVFANVFEPAVSMLAKLKKAEQVGRSKGAHGEADDSDKEYKEKLMAGSRKQYLGEK